MLKENRNVRSGIVGAGYAAGFHFEAIRKVYGAAAEVVGVNSLEGAEEFAAARGIKVFDGLDELLDAVDLVHVCTASSAHEEVALAALKRGKSVIVEKPLTGFFGDGSEGFRGDVYPKEAAREQALASVRRMLDAERAGKGRILYAENWVYAPAIQKEREIIEKSGAQILFMRGEQAHSGSHSPVYGYWKYSGGGPMLSKGCHPLSAALYLKAVEGRTRDGKPILPASVSARIHALTGMPGFRDEGQIRRGYFDIEDSSMMHVVFDDGATADIFASDIVVGGVHNWLEVGANNHRTICNINPNTAMQTYNAREENFKDIYVVEKIGTKQGWSNPSPEEDWFSGYSQEIEAFYRAAAYGEPVESDSLLAANTVSTIYSAYVSAERGGAEVGIETF